VKNIKETTQKRKKEEEEKEKMRSVELTQMEF